MRVVPSSIAALLLAGALATPVPALQAQSLLDRSDNLSADWIGNTGTVYFNFIHRFSTSPPPERKVSNFPTFLIATGIASRALVGLNYATNSVLVPRYPNEFEFFARYAPWQQEAGRLLDVGGQVDYNLSVRGVDGELSVARRQGPVRLIVVGRVLADTIEGGAMHLAVGGGGTIRLMKYVALAGDAATMTGHGDGERVVWSAGVHIALPNTPHTLSIHASNANTATLQGLSRGGGVRRYGFEFTIPVTLSRFFHPDAAPEAADAPTEPAMVTPAPAAAPTPAAASVDSAARAQMQTTAADTVRADTARADIARADTALVAAPDTAVRRSPRPASAAPPRVVPKPARRAAPKLVNVRIKGLAYVPARIEIPVGTTVQWRNLDPLQHTVTATDRSFTSPQFGLEGSWKHTFTKPGTYAVYCILHPNMKATVVVK